MNLHTQILIEFKQSNLKIINEEKLIQYIHFCIDNNQLEVIQGKSAHHHILPQAESCFPQFSDLVENEWNGTHLLYSDHYYAHWLFTEAIENYSQLSAFVAMHNMNPKLELIKECDLIPAEEYQKKMEQRSINQSEWYKNNPDKLLLREAKRNKTISKRTKEEVEAISRKISDSKKGSKNAAAARISIYNDKDELMYDCKGTFNQICAKHNLPKRSLQDSYKNNTKLYSKELTHHNITRLKNNNTFQYRNWYAVKGTLNSTE